MKIVIPLLFLIALIGLVALSVRHFIAKLRNLTEVFGLTRAKPAFVRGPFGTPEYNRRAILLQIVNPAHSEAELKAAGHLSGAPDPARNFGDVPCWLRYERNGFWVDYMNHQASWQITPVPPDVTLGICDGNGIVQLHRASGGLWGYDSLNQSKFSDIKPEAPKHPQRTLPFDSLDLCNKDHFEWLKTQRDPELWHVAAMAAFAYTDDPHQFLSWLIEQPELDRSTAGFLFLAGNAGRYLKGETRFYGNGMSGNPYPDLMKRLAKRSETCGFSRDDIGLEPSFEVRRQEILDQVQRREIAPDRMVPFELINTPYPAAKWIGLYVEEGVVVL